MSVPLKPHTVTVRPISQATDPTTKVKGTPKEGTQVIVAGFVQPLSPSQAFEDYGLDLRSPVRVFIESADASSFPPGAQFVFNSVTYAVRGEPQIFGYGTGLDHAVILAEGLQIPNAD